MLISTKWGQPWSEAKGMSDVDRKAFIFVGYQFEGFSVDWQTGQLIPPPKPR